LRLLLLYRMKKKPIVMKDVAAKAGVHQTTVSLALNNDPRISAATRDRIQKLAKEMGYVPNPVLASLVSYRRSKSETPYRETVALIFDVGDFKRFEESHYLTSIRDAVISRARELGYKAEVFHRGVDFSSSEMLDRVLRTRNIHGVLFCDIHKDDLCYNLNWSDYSLVKINQTPMSLKIDSVMGNYFFSARNAMRKLKEAGYKRPAMAGSVIEEHNTRNLYRAGFEYGQRRHFEPENHVPFYEFDRRPNAEIENEIYEWLKIAKPDVLLSYWNNLARSAYRLTMEGHFCRFVCLEADEKNHEYGGILNNYSNMARTAVDSLISKMKLNIRGIPEHPTLLLVEEKWLELGSWPPGSPPV